MKFSTVKRLRIQYALPLVAVVPFSVMASCGSEAETDVLWVAQDILGWGAKDEIFVFTENSNALKKVLSSIKVSSNRDDKFVKALAEIEALFHLKKWTPFEAPEYFQIGTFVSHLRPTDGSAPGYDLQVRIRTVYVLDIGIYEEVIAAIGYFDRDGVEPLLSSDAASVFAAIRAELQLLKKEFINK